MSEGRDEAPEAVGWVEQLRAVLDEDERSAREATARSHTSRRMIDGRMVDVPTRPSRWRQSEWPPERVLDIVLAHRKILADYVTVMAIKDAAWAKMRAGALLTEREARECGEAERAETTLLRVLEHIAQGYGIET